MSDKHCNNCLKFSSVLLLLLFFQLSFAQRTTKEMGIENFKELNVLLQQNQKILGGDVVAMVWTDTLVFKKEMGDFTFRTVAPVASCSKWLTAALVMQLVDEGKISLDDKVSQYIPIFSSYMKNYITIRHCLAHLTGIQSEATSVLKLLERKKFASLEEEVNDFAKKHIQANPGEEFRYGNIGLNIAGRIVEIVGKKKFDLLAQQKLFRPLGMRQTTFSTLDGSAINPSGGARSTPQDYLQFLVMLLNKGQYKGKQILSEQSVAELRKIQTTPQLIKYAPAAANGFQYASGSWVLESKGTEATALSSPGLLGTWPIVDFCRGYACIFFTKSLPNEQKADAYLQMKQAIDEKRVKKCE